MALIPAINGGSSGDKTLYRHEIPNYSSHGTGSSIIIDNVRGNVKSLLIENTSSKATVLGFIDDNGTLYKTPSTGWTYYPDATNLPKLTQVGTTIVMGKGTSSDITANCWYWSDEL